MQQSRRLFRGCATTPACAAKYPNLEQDANALVDDINAHPYQATVTDPTTGQAHDIVLTGDDVLAGSYFALSVSSLIPRSPP